MEKLLVLGADRVVGAHLAECLADRFAVIAAAEGAEHESQVACEGEAACLASPTALSELVLRHAPQWTVYCGPCSASSWDGASTPELSGEAERALAVASAIERVGGRLTVLSTDAVFTGPRIFHAEDSPTAGGHPLADAALTMEAVVEASGALIVRTHAFGIGLNGCSFAHRAAAALLAGEPVAADGRRYASPIFAGDLAELLLGAYESGLRGGYHIAGGERVSQWRFVEDLAASLGVDFVLNGSTQTALGAADRLETSLVCRRAQRALSRPLPGLLEGLAEFAVRCERDLSAGHALELRAVAA